MTDKLDGNLEPSISHTAYPFLVLKIMQPLVKSFGINYTSISKSHLLLYGKILKIPVPDGSTLIPPG